MIWLFERGNEAIRIETRKEVGEFVLTVYWHDGQCQVERFADARGFVHACLHSSGSSQPISGNRLGIRG